MGMIYRESMHPGGVRLTDRAARLAGISSGMEVLDVGCGNGVSLGFLERSFGVVPYGMDISEKLIGSARQRLPAAALTVGDAAWLPYQDASFDAVICECVLSLVEDAGWVLSEMRRVLRPLGMLILSDVCVEEEFGRVQGMFLKVGFDVICLEEHKAALTTYIAERYAEGKPAEAWLGDSSCERGTYYLIVCQRGG
ncbi:MAG: class I SAM-dependent methyltransferase [Oscillospiraceae bacterium]|nr:class I SAM-dependent methyltransferase [Oscillospiraceae bacterium]